VRVAAAADGAGKREAEGGAGSAGRGAGVGMRAVVGRGGTRACWEAGRPTAEGQQQDDRRPGGFGAAQAGGRERRLKVIAGAHGDREGSRQGSDHSEPLITVTSRQGIGRDSCKQEGCLTGGGEGVPREVLFKVQPAESGKEGRGGGAKGGTVKNGVEFVRKRGGAGGRSAGAVGTRAKGVRQPPMGRVGNVRGKGAALGAQKKEGKRWVQRTADKIGGGFEEIETQQVLIEVGLEGRIAARGGNPGEGPGRVVGRQQFCTP